MDSNRCLGTKFPTKSQTMFRFEPWKVIDLINGIWHTFGVVVKLSSKNDIYN